MTDKTHDPDSPAARLSGISSDLPGHDATKSSWAFLIRFELNSELNVDFICSLFSSSFLLFFFTSSLLIILWPFLRSDGLLLNRAVALPPSALWPRQVDPCFAGCGDRSSSQAHSPPIRQRLLAFAVVRSLFAAGWQGKNRHTVRAGLVDSVSGSASPRGSAVAAVLLLARLRQQTRSAPPCFVARGARLITRYVNRSRSLSQNVARS